MLLLYSGSSEEVTSGIFVQILAGNIIFRHLMRVDFLFLGILGVFHAFHYIRLERVSFLKQFVDAFRIRTFAPGQSLPISRLSSGGRGEPFS